MVPSAHETAALPTRCDPNRLFHNGLRSKQIDRDSSSEDFARPGHVFPLCARAGGVLERRGQTEAAVDLAALAGLRSAGVICEIVNDDGTMARVPDLIRFCRRHGLMMITVADLARHRNATG